MKQQIMGCKLERGNSRGLSETLLKDFLGKTEENREKHLSGYLVSGTRYEPTIRSANQSIPTTGIATIITVIVVIINSLSSVDSGSTGV
jgi:hypothetical protein